MAWADIKQCYEELARECGSGEALAKPWTAFKSLVQATKESPPYHLKTLLGVLERARGARPSESVMILEHGCGSGITLLYLLARGYTGVHGVDLESSSVCQWNRLLREECGITEPRFQRYDGRILPMKDASVDVVFSMQVLEHVQPDIIDQYYSEEGRVLKELGIAFHQIPHRLVPYDSHTRTWGIHYFPRSLRQSLYRLSGNDPDYVERILHLRSPFYHRTQLIRQIGTCEDVTLDRLKGVDIASYDGPKRLRVFIAKATRVPAIGWLIGQALRNFVMLDVIAVKARTVPVSMHGADRLKSDVHPRLQA